MANKVNNWKELLKMANEDLKKYNAEIGVYDHDDVYSVTTVVNGLEEEYADNYYEDELQDLINDAWAHARAKAKAKSETIYSEVKCTYHEDGFWSVDAYKTNNQEEEGVVLAVINDVTGDCYAIRALDDTAKGVIDEKQTEIVAQRPAILAEIYNGMTDAEKDEFLRMTGNQ
jgi:hypothetical protein